MKLAAFGVQTFRHAVDLVLPRRCLGCGVVVAGDGGVCPGCWDKLEFIASPLCSCCGLPFAFDPGSGGLCGACARARPVFGKARSAVVYNDASRDLILSFKHADRTDAAPVWGNWLARAGGELLEGADVLIPVPLHYRRLVARRYNQAALIAFALGRRAGLPVCADALARTRPTPSQGRMSRAQRERNVQGGFAVRPQRYTRVAGKRVLLIDDVMTTGATLAACTRPLLKSGAASVDALTLARVTRTGG